MLKLGIVLVLCLFYNEVFGYKILVIFPIPAKSHVILGNGYVTHLLNAGHEITYITPELYKEAHPNLTIIDVSDNYKFFPEEMLDIKHLMDTKAKFTDTMIIIHLMHELCKNTLSNTNVKKLLEEDQTTYDLIIAEWAYNELYAGFSAVYNCPFIWSTSIFPQWAILRMVDESTNPAYTADGSSGNTPPFSFRQRLQELWGQITMTYGKWIITAKDNDIYVESFGPPTAKKGRNLPLFNDLQFNASLVLGNSNPPFSPAIRLPANYKEIGGYHIETHVTPLSEDLKTIMDNAKYGVIYFSMGSNAKSKDLPDGMKQDLLKAFGQLKQLVLWKFEEDLPKVPNNVHLLKWAPQPSILSHPNCVLFISHGGLLSTTEAIHYGKPIIGVPVFGDQFLNVQRAVDKGFAIRVDLSEHMAAPLQKAIYEIINNKRYTNKAKELSAIFHDRLLTPNQELVHWVEHVVRTGGAAHLRSPALLVPLYQKLYLDLISLIMIIVFFVKLLFCRFLYKKNISKSKRE